MKPGAGAWFQRLREPAVPATSGPFPSLSTASQMVALEKNWRLDFARNLVDHGMLYVEWEINV